MKTCMAAGLPAAVGTCVLFLAAGAAWAQQVLTDPNNKTAAEPTESTDGTTLPKLVVTSPKAKKKASAKKVTGKGTGAGTAEGGATGEAAKQDSGGVGGSPNADVIVDGILLGGPSVSDTGTTIFDSRNVRMRTDGSGDANSFLRNLPNVQYQNDTDTNAGVSLQDVINTRPLELSINGARAYENNFVLNGVPINNVTGTVERSDSELADTDQVPNADLVYGLHPQTIFVPTEFLDRTSIVDSNGSAANAGALGGTVFYDLAAPPTDRYRASITYSRHTDEMVNWLLATPAGTNPLDRKAPTFEKNNLAVSVGAPITTDLSFIAQASRKTAETEKQKAYKMFDTFVAEESENIFLRFATTLKTDIGRFTFDTSLTDYTQDWESYTWRDMVMDVDTQGSSSLSAVRTYRTF